MVEVKNPTFGYETWVNVRLRDKTSWLRRSIERQLWDELGPLCEAFATTILPCRSIDENTSREQVGIFEAALSKVDFSHLKEMIYQQILEGTAGPSYIDFDVADELGKGMVERT